ncbi:sigma-E factor regulatory protein RseB [Actinobacillus succinogenes]|uniref:Sigma E regulatory protein, MucB/RseB n=1 Tax=Actinobacillus succinogenes (strain ATCC 55618 / DSM 22257 / CCUG 43843 / 130Z) TaxID=339671 RepID=A6VKY3_ACTSZ|nr:sigma-E factor regulatory protein RseB [Actinobacillus succinogenes]ABR73630.1 sigma E regulatory protein, MucB/RseB [Actinobacillus succinogenes 130Z]PHI39910.1 sigma-E factor regulatory protein RseB [Actinobacillus succinogenes]
MLKILQKPTALFACLLSFLLAAPVWAGEELSPQQLLNSMTQAEQQLNYQFIFVQNDNGNNHALQYRYSLKENKKYAQMTTMDGVKRDIIQRDDMVSYFRPQMAPFTLKSKYIVDNLPPLMQANFNKLAKYYDFTALGRNRIADRMVQMVRITPKDNFRYRYVAFIDEETHLLLRSDLLDQDGVLLDQFRIIQLAVSETPLPFVESVEQLPFPPLISAQSRPGKSSNWKLNWLPQGFRQIRKTETTDDEGNNTESRFYSDGLFTFEIFVSDGQKDEAQNSSLRHGAVTIYSETVNDKEITLIGQLPIGTAKRIVQDLKF